MSSPVVFSLTAAQLDYLRMLDLFPAAFPTFNKRIGLALAKSALVQFKGRRPYLTDTGHAAARLAHLVAKASPVPASDSSPVVERDGRRVECSPGDAAQRSAVS